MSTCRRGDGRDRRCEKVRLVRTLPFRLSPRGGQQSLRATAGCGSAKRKLLRWSSMSLTKPRYRDTTHFPLVTTRSECQVEEDYYYVVVRDWKSADGGRRGQCAPLPPPPSSAVACSRAGTPLMTMMMMIAAAAAAAPVLVRPPPAAGGGARACGRPPSHHDGGSWQEPAKKQPSGSVGRDCRVDVFVDHTRGASPTAPVANCWKRNGERVAGRSGPEA